MEKVRCTHTTQIIPLAITVWCCWDNGELEGPLQVVAMACGIDSVSYERPVEVEVEHHGKRRYQRFTIDGSNFGSIENEASQMEYTSTWVLIPSFPGNNWIEMGEHCFFSKEEAEEVAERRKKTCANKNKGE